MKDTNKPYILVFKKMKQKFPLCRYVSRTKDNGVTKCRRTVTFDFERAVKFKDREEALFYISNLYEKYPDDVKRLYPMKIKCLLKKWKRKPLRQLHTNIIIFPKKEQVEQ